MLTNTKNNKITQHKSGAEIITDILISNGVDTIFGYPGSPILALYDSLSKTNKIKHYLARHEQGAIHAAEGYARVKGKCGVVLVTSGPGVTNTITGILNSHSDRTPLLIICAQSENLEKNEFQDVDITKISSGYTKKTYFINNSENLVQTITNAVNDANKIPQGPVVVALTKSVLEDTVPVSEYRLRKEIKVEAPQSCVLRALDMLKNAKRPLLIVGGGCTGSENEVREFANLTHIPVVNTLMASGVIDDLSMGLIGHNGIETLNKTILSADVVIALGCRFSDRTTCYKDKFLTNSKIININIEQNSSKNVNIDEEILGELGIVVQQMIGTIKSKNIMFDIHYKWIDELFPANYIKTSDNQTLTTKNAIKEIYEYTKKYNPVLTTDVGNHQISASKIFKTKSSRHFLTSGGFGTMGYGLPAAIGAYIAKPDSTVLNITGDGSFQMNIQELGMCAEYNIPIKIFIMNNSELGMIKDIQNHNGYAEYQSHLINPDFIKIASAYGILGYDITTIEELRRALSEIFTYKKAVVLNIKVTDI